MNSGLRTCRGLLRCGNSESASTIPEYAMMLGILVSAASGFFYLLGSSAGGVFSAAGRRLAGDAAVSDSAGAARDPGTAPVPAGAGEATDGTPATSCCSYVLVALLGGAAALAIAWQARRRRRRARTTRKSDEAPRIQRDELHLLLCCKRQQLLRLLAEDGDVLLKNRLAVRHLMTAQVVTAAPSATHDEMTALMSQKRVRHLLVCDAGGRLLGVVSNRDLRCSRGKTARHVMSTSPHTVGPGTPLSPAITYMIRHGISCLPVLDAGRLCGILTTTDLILTLQCSLQYLLRGAVEKDASADESPEECDEPAAMQV